MSDEIEYLADKVHVHRWPQESPLWDDDTKKYLDKRINQNLEKKKIIIGEKSIQIQDITFTNLDKIGVSIPFFKNECTLITESQFGNLSAHLHITIKSGNYLEIFNKLISWRINFNKL